MGSIFTELVELVKSSGVFKRNKKSVEIKVLASLLYFFGLSLRVVSEILSGFESISHETVRKCYLRGDKSTREEEEEVNCDR